MGERPQVKGGELRFKKMDLRSSSSGQIFCSDLKSREDGKEKGTERWKLGGKLRRRKIFRQVLRALE